MSKRSTFGSGFGTIAVVGGSVIGLGNIWRFPYVAGENGGAAFILMYIAVSFLISVPIMLSEFTIGRRSQANSMRAYGSMSKTKAWQGIGYLGIATAATILSFYSVIAGWSIEFIKESFTGEFMDKTPLEIESTFKSFIASGWKPLIWTFVFISATAFIVASGIEKGIERFNKVAMPMMFVILLLMCINSLTLSGFNEGASFLLKPDFSKVGLGTLLKAMGQSFFSLSLGMGIMVTYGSYIKKSQNMFRIAGTVAISDVTIAILAGIAIFPAVFTFGIDPVSGPELVFLTLPNIFAQMTGGQILAVMFFTLLFVAAITSSVSLLEVVVAYIHEEFGFKRRTATIGAGLFTAGLSALCIVSQIPGSSVAIGGYNVFDFFDYVTSTYMIPLGGFLAVIFAGWVMNEKIFRNEMTNNGLYGNRYYTFLRPMIKFVIPLIIAILFLNQIGILK